MKLLGVSKEESFVELITIQLMLGEGFTIIDLFGVSY
jgi:hypothetical protein